ncbi:Wzz/FepE/Etk N-terminal domain-containing protein [Emcibacteraceae bacterium]|nr:Wzz/FepE/Etk N-terminal domain-containing protein [Emcibacteraceae bacterium]
MLNQDGFFNIFTIGREIKKQKYIFASIFLVCVLTAYLFSILSTPKYEAQITLLPLTQEGESSINSNLNAVSSLLGNITSGSAERPAWLEATIVMQTRNFAKEFIASQNIMQVLMDEHDIKGNWEELTDNERKPLLNIIARHWIGKNIELEHDPLTNVYYFTVFSNDKEMAVTWAREYVKMINAHLKFHLIDELEHKIDFYRNRIADEKINEIKSSVINLLSVSIQKRALIDTREEIVLRAIDPADLAILSFPILTLNLAIGIFLGLILALVTVLFIGAYKQYSLSQ